ncbi:hypothetical protein FRX31_008554, partial [Thalictrum thalictroides]
STHRSGERLPSTPGQVKTSEHPSDHTRIWSELSGSAARSGSGADAHVQESVNAGEESGMQRVTMIGNARAGAATENVPNDPYLYPEIRFSLFIIFIVLHTIVFLLFVKQAIFGSGDTSSPSLVADDQGMYSIFTALAT